MLGWLNSVLHWGISGLDDLWNKVIGVVKAVYGYIDGWITSVANYLSQVYGDFITFATQVVNWINRVTTAIESWVQRIYADFQSWVVRLFNTLYQYAINVYNFTVRWIGYLRTAIDDGITSIVNWVIRNIWNPLYGAISSIYKWVTTNGYWVFYMITHPEMLAKLIVEYVLAEWTALAGKYSGVVARWILHSMLSQVSTIGGILGDVIAKVL